MSDEVLPNVTDGRCLECGGTLRDDDRDHMCKACMEALVYAMSLDKPWIRELIVAAKKGGE